MAYAATGYSINHKSTALKRADKLRTLRCGHKRHCGCIVSTVVRVVRVEPKPPVDTKSPEFIARRRSMLLRGC